jgi:hypothetical protein
MNIFTRRDYSLDCLSLAGPLCQKPFKQNKLHLLIPYSKLIFIQFFSFLVSFHENPSKKMNVNQNSKEAKTCMRATLRNLFSWSPDKKV